MLEQRYREYKQLAKKITGGDERYLDLLHDILIQFETNDTWNNLSTKKEQMFYLSRALSNQFYSKNSRFQRTYRKFNTEAVDIPEVPDEPYIERPSIEWMNQVLQQELENNPQNWYNVGLFKLYIQHKKIDLIHKKTKIPKYSIRDTIKQMKLWIKNKWSER